MIAWGLAPMKQTQTFASNILEHAMHQTCWWKKGIYESYDTQKLEKSGQAEMDEIQHYYCSLQK